MFDKIIIENGKIVVEKYTVEWVETIDHKAKLAKNKNSISRTKNFADKIMLDKFVADLAKKNIVYTVKNIDVPASVAAYDGQKWLQGRENAINYVNAKL